jgi:hypothetical protein
MKLRRGRRVGRRQALIQMIAPLFASFVAELRAHARIARRRFAEPLQESPDIETGPAHYQRQPAPPMQFFDDTAGMLTEKTGIEGLVRIDAIEKMVGDALAGPERRFVGPHIHPAIKLAGIGGEDLSVELLGKGDADAAFSNRRRPDDHYQRFPAELGFRK